MSRAFAAFLGALALMGPATAPAVAKLPVGFAGLVSEDAYGGSNGYQRKTLSRIHSVGFTMLRQTFDWKYAEPSAGRFSFVLPDRFVLAAARAHIQVMPILFGEPKWASSRTKKQRKSHNLFPPKKAATFAAYAAAVAARYGPGGTLWRTHPGVTPMPTTAYQIWNEPNLGVYWRGHPTAKGYAALLAAAASAVRAVQPDAEIVSGGMPQSKQGIKLTTYVRSLLHAGAASSMTTLAVNPYANTANGVVGHLRAIRKILDAAGATSVGLRATEFGWADNGPRGHFRVSSRKQASLISATFRALAKARTGLQLRGAVYFDWRDAKPYSGGKDFWGLHTGLQKRNGKNKPVIAKLRKTLRLLH